MKKTTIILTLTKTTKGTYVFSNDQKGINWYIPKAMFDGEPPKEMKVTLEENK